MRSDFSHEQWQLNYRDTFTLGDVSALLPARRGQVVTTTEIVRNAQGNVDGAVMQQ